MAPNAPATAGSSPAAAGSRAGGVHLRFRKKLIEDLRRGCLYPAWPTGCRFKCEAPACALISSRPRGRRDRLAWPDRHRAILMHHALARPSTPLPRCRCVAAPTQWIPQSGTKTVVGVFSEKDREEIVLTGGTKDAA